RHLRQGLLDPVGTGGAGHPLHAEGGSLHGLMRLLLHPHGSSRHRDPSPLSSWASPSHALAARAVHARALISPPQVYPHRVYWGNPHFRKRFITSVSSLTAR